MSCAGCCCELGDNDPAIEVCRDRLYCLGCAVPLTPAMKAYVDSTITGE